ncbi:hypothetical protein LOTGIDRAFT_219736 [Lottia gigantea]|uniref:DUF1731 domain-containing protein n=1 Tax=Lottia gigantea TaxID=225164 RepID=V3ZU14_LOTGI|nr:hypothetical protein LOTGIDRAFT_219736 [Lottia gigantea]ESO87842.1 hypothetical protein LOTGIDRAFT_219736 [Lottia gigantea]
MNPALKANAYFNVLIGGGSGFIGKELVKHLRMKHNINSILVSRSSGEKRITWNDLERRGLPENCIAVVNLSGENILNPLKRFSEDFKEEVRRSRIDTTKKLADAIVKAEKKPQVFVTMSGVAYYPPDENKVYDEDNKCEEYDFLSKLTKDWEAASNLPDSVSVRQVTVRSGVVLGRNGGMIDNIRLPFKMGLGGVIGSGKQWLPWIHLSDIAGIFDHAIQNDNVSGILNGVAPEATTYAQFVKAYAKAMHKPAFFPTPAFAMNTIFGPERAKVILEGQNVMPKRTLESGFKFEYPTIEKAVDEIVNIYIPREAVFKE